MSEITELHISPEEFSELKDWSLLHESEFLGHVYTRYPWLRSLSPGSEVKVIIDYE